MRICVYTPGYLRYKTHVLFYLRQLNYLSINIKYYLYCVLYTLVVNKCLNISIKLICVYGCACIYNIYINTKNCTKRVHVA